MKRKASAVWQGSGKDGNGMLSTQSGAFNQQPYSARLRFENEDGKQGTNPEELIGAAHAGCFAMALAFQISGAGFTADELHVDAQVNMERQEGGGWSITASNLNLVGKVPGISEEQFLELAEAAKKNCPVSRALNVDISLSAELK